MKYRIILLLLLLLGLRAAAECIVTDIAGEPMVGAIVMDSRGTPIGIVGDDGAIPDLAPTCYPLTVKCIGFEPATVSTSDERVVMVASSRLLGEVQVSTKDRPALYMLCLMRETCGAISGADTVRIVAEYMVDYMLPAFKGAKTPTWEYPRVLDQRIEVYKNFDHEVQPESFTWGTTFGTLSNRVVNVPDSISRGLSATYTLNGKYGKDWVVRLNPDSSLITTRDYIANCKDHVYTASFAKILGLTMDITQDWKQTTYAPSSNLYYSTPTITGHSIALKIIGRGRNFRKILPNAELPVELFTYIEINPIDICYLTRDDARDLKKHRPNAPLPQP